MPLLPSARPRLPRGRAFTLVEITLVVSILVALSSLAFVGVTSYREGANRAVCIHQVANMQKVMRAYCNLEQLAPGQEMTDLVDRLQKETQVYRELPHCPSGGEYHFHKEGVPEIGSLLMSCSLDAHQPRETVGW